MRYAFHNLYGKQHVTLDQRHVGFEIDQLISKAPVEVCYILIRSQADQGCPEERYGSSTGVFASRFSQK